MCGKMLQGVLNGKSYCIFPGVTILKEDESILFIFLITPLFPLLWQNVQVCFELKVLLHFTRWPFHQKMNLFLYSFLIQPPFPNVWQNVLSVWNWKGYCIFLRSDLFRSQRPKGHVTHWNKMQHILHVEQESYLLSPGVSHSRINWYE